MPHLMASMWTGFWNGLGGISEWPPPHKPAPVWSCGGIRPGGHAYDAYNAYRCLQMPTGNLRVSAVDFLRGGTRAGGRRAAVARRGNCSAFIEITSNPVKVRGHVN